MSSLAVILTGDASESGGLLFQKRKKPDLTGLVLFLEDLGADEILIVGQNALKSRFIGWFEKERNRFRKAVTLRFYYGTAGAAAFGALMRLLRLESLEHSILLVFFNKDTPLDPPSLKRIFCVCRRCPSPVIGVRKSNGTAAAGAVALGERNRIIRFSACGRIPGNEWEPAGLYYFPERFLAESIPVFMKSISGNSAVFETLIAWTVRNFKVYAHVFAAHPGS